MNYCYVQGDQLPEKPGKVVELHIGKEKVSDSGKSHGNHFSFWRPARATHWI